MNDEEKEFAEAIAVSTAKEVAKASTGFRRPWLQAWGIPSAIILLLGTLTHQLYDDMRVTQAENSKLNQSQNETLAVTTSVLKTLKEGQGEIKAELKTVRSDPFTGKNGKEQRNEILSEVKDNEKEIRKLKERQQELLIESERTKTALESLLP